jgi:hypothetical protein
VGDEERATSLTNVQAQHTNMPDKRHDRRRLGSEAAATLPPSERPFVFMLQAEARDGGA